MTEPQPVRRLSVRNTVRSFVVPLSVAAVVVIVIFLLFGQMEQDALDLLDTWRSKPLWFSFYSALILTSDIVLPIPSSIVMYLNGFVLGTGYGAFLSFATLMVSSLIGYGLGRLPRFGAKEVRRASGSFMERYGSYAILLTRGIPILSESICFVCGYRSMPLKKYLLLNAAGFLPICFLYACMGDSGSEANAFLLALILSILVTGLFWAFGWFLEHRRSV